MYKIVICIWTCFLNRFRSGLINTHSLVNITIIPIILLVFFVLNKILTTSGLTVERQPTLTTTMWERERDSTGWYAPICCGRNTQRNPNKTKTRQFLCRLGVWLGIGWQCDNRIPRKIAHFQQNGQLCPEKSDFNFSFLIPGAGGPCRPQPATGQQEGWQSGDSTGYPQSVSQTES